MKSRTVFSVIFLPWCVIRTAAAEHESVVAIGDAMLIPSNARIANVVPDRVNTSRIFAVTSDHLPSAYASTDGGRSWTPLSRAGLDCATTQCRAVAIDPFDSNHLVVASDRGLHYSNDAGATWTRSALAGDFQFTAFDPFRSQTVLASTADRSLYRSLDGGKNWRYAAGVPNSTLTDIAFSDLDPNHLLLVTTEANSVSDDGPTWRTSSNLMKSTTGVGAMASADLKITVSSRNFTIMSPGNLTIEVTNQGLDVATGIQVTVPQPTNLAFESIYLFRRNPVEPVVSCSVGATQLVCQVGDLNVGQTVTLAASLKFGSPSGSSTVLMSASVVSDVPDPNPQDNSASTSAMYFPPASLTAPPTNTGMSGGGGSIGISLVFLFALLTLARLHRLRRSHKYSHTPVG